MGPALSSVRPKCFPSIAVLWLAGHDHVTRPASHQPGTKIFNISQLFPHKRSHCPRQKRMLLLCDVASFGFCLSNIEKDVGLAIINEE
jgi:hypothetical protein